MRRTTTGLRLNAIAAAVLVVASWAAAPSLLQAQAASASLAADLAAQLDQRKLDSIAVSLGGGEWVAALHLGGSELLVVKGRVTSGSSLESMVTRKAYRDLYIAINSAAEPESKLLVSDVGANGLRATLENKALADTVERGERQRAFDGDWAGAGMTEAEYRSAFRAADEEYTRMLQALLTELRRP